MAINKVIYEGETLMDITDSTVTSDNLGHGVVAYAANGERIVGTATNSGVSIPSESIIDVIELPTEDINSNAIYRLMTAQWICRRQTGEDAGVCYVVDALPEVGESVTDTSMSYFIGYYNTSDGIVYGYADETIAGAFGISSGWYPFESMASIAGLGFNGVFSDVNDSPMNDYFGALIGYAYYSYKDSWRKMVFAEELAPKIDIRWDGNMDGRIALDMSALGYDAGIYFVKVSDTVLTTDDVLGGKIYARYSSSTSDHRVITEQDIDTATWPGAFTVTELCVVVYSDTDLANALGIPAGIYTNGVYFWKYADSAAGGYVSRFVEPITINKIDGKYIDVESLGFHTVAKTGDYNLLNNRPTVYTDVVRYGTQSFNESQKRGARNNIDVYSRSEVKNMIAEAIGSAIGGSY